MIGHFHYRNPNDVRYLNTRCLLVPNVPVGNANFETLFQLDWITTDSKANRMSRLDLNRMRKNEQSVFAGNEQR